MPLSKALHTILLTSTKWCKLCHIKLFVDNNRLQTKLLLLIYLKTFINSLKYVQLKLNYNYGKA